jgi:four helix bundle suffix protein
MFQAARSSKQCLVEGYTQASLKGYIYMAGIAHGSNEELREDYKDFLRQRNLPIWKKDHPQLGRKSWVSRACRDIAMGKIPTYPTIPTDPTYAANVILDLTIKAGYLLNKLIASLHEKHKTEGGLTERLYRTRKQYRGY